MRTETQLEFSKDLIKCHLTPRKYKLGWDRRGEGVWGVKGGGKVKEKRTKMKAKKMQEVKKIR